METRSVSRSPPWLPAARLRQQRPPRLRTPLTPPRAEAAKSPKAELRSSEYAPEVMEQQLRRTAFSRPETELRRCGAGRSASDARMAPARQRARITAPVRGVPVYVMLPLDTVWLLERDGTTQPLLIREKAMEVGLEMLSRAGVDGVMIDVWWGIAEHAGPGQYDFSAYRKLFEQVASKGLKVQAVMSFHAAGNNVGDCCRISLPRWVLEAGEADPDIFFTDNSGDRKRECLSGGADEQPVLAGRTPIQAQADFIAAFADEFGDLLGGVITEVTIGMGPAGELRYPSYPEGDGRWRFPGIGQFQCYDKYMLASLREAALAAGHPEWGHGGPHDSGHYNSHSSETGFFKSYGGSWDTEYGRFFLGWYSGLLIQHADRLLGAARQVLSARCRPRTMREARELSDGGMLYVFEPAVQLGIKLAGVHWWFKSRAHAAELTAGYYNTRERNGYLPIFEMLKRHSATASFTCVEMRDCEHPIEGRCSPEGLLNQVLSTAARAGVPMSGENALQRYDQWAFDKICDSAFGQSVMAGRLEKLTFLRMGDMMIDNWSAFGAFLQRLTCPPS
ncbi:hypothetical protein COHA_009381 [Chlorella ohadii]|uniref:Beta-amylase n=1 Tax=Chlorella ohadii TaxID=2649997 RepID=A0AAD5DI34_9CHLO|nr:hypothetical protein COHA_009381 [Chlorella ohadii]